MKTYLRSTKLTPAGTTASIPSESMVSTSTQLKSEDLRISRRWEKWKPIVSLYFLGGAHGEKCLRQGCPCAKKYTELVHVKESHSRGLRGILRLGLQMRTIIKHNLDSPMLTEVDRMEYAKACMKRKVYILKGNRNANKQ